MKITFLGTSSGVPTKSRNVSAIAIECGDNKNWFLVDCGEATQHQLLHTRLSLKNLGAILITHVHGDHCYGLPGLLASTAMTGRLNPLVIIAPAPIENFINVIIETTELHLTYPIKFIDVDSINESINLFGISLTTIALSHRVASYAFQFSQEFNQGKLDHKKLENLGIPRGPLWGKLQTGQDIQLEDGRLIRSSDVLDQTSKILSTVICGDNDKPELIADLVKQDIDLVIHEATYTQDIADKVGNGPQHSSAKQVAKAFEKAGLKNLILTHFSARYSDKGDSSPSISELELEARSHYSGNLYLASDLAQYELTLSSELFKQ